MNKLFDYAITALICLTTYLILDRVSNASEFDKIHKLPHKLEEL